MSNHAFLIFPVHLFKNIYLLKDYKTIYLIEEPRYFTDYAFHKLKLAYHRASMKYYESYLIKHKFNVKYIEFNEVNNNFYKSLYKKYDIIKAYDPNDHTLELKLTSNKIEFIPSLNFCITRTDLYENSYLFYNKKSKRFNFMNFYKMMRTKLNILVSKNGTPVGGKWSFDEENRKPYPTKNGPKIPDLPKVNSNNHFIQEANNYVEKHFPKNYGSLDYFIYPITHEESKKWCENFCKERFKYFGLYEDAIIHCNENEEKEIKNSEFLFHSVLSPMMNIGLITDYEVLDIVLKYEKKVPIAAFEGFIRQVIGWRNYIYGVYTLKYGNHEMSIPKYYKYIGSMNFMKHKEQLPYKHFWEGTTGILPVDDAIKTIQKYAYVHHIQRLMVLGNVLLLLKINPNDVFKIFMEWTVDAYEWVMTGNVYGMTQHADGGILMTRPYFSSSNYILNMSNYKCASNTVGNNNDWCKVWDALYGTFIDKHSAYLKRNYSTARMVTFYSRKSLKEKASHKKILSTYLKSLKNTLKKIKN
jgi:deoxyribodipyrimidine photolyase-related protein